MTFVGNPGFLLSTECDEVNEDFNDAGHGHELKCDPEAEFLVVKVKTELHDEEDPLRLFGNESENEFVSQDLGAENSEAEEGLKERKFTQAKRVIKRSRKKMSHDTRRILQRRRRKEQKAREADEKRREDLQILEGLLTPGNVESTEKILVHPEVDLAWEFVELSDGTRRRKTVDEMTPEERLFLWDLWKRQERTRKANDSRSASGSKGKSTNGERNKKETSEEKKMKLKMNRYMARVARLATLTPEEKEARRLRGNELRRKQVAKLRQALGRDKYLEMKRKQWHSMRPEKKQSFKESQKEYYKRKMEMLKGDPEKYAAFRATEAIRKRRALERKKLPTPKRRGAKLNLKKKFANCTPEQWKVINMMKKSHLIERSELRQQLKEQGLSEIDIENQVEVLIASQNAAFSDSVITKKIEEVVAPEMVRVIKERSRRNREEARLKNGLGPSVRKSSVKVRWKQNLTNCTPEQIKFLELARKRQCYQRTKLRRQLSEQGLPHEEVEEQVKLMIAKQNCQLPQLPVDQPIELKPPRKRRKVTNLDDSEDSSGPVNQQNNNRSTKEKVSKYYKQEKARPQQKSQDLVTYQSPSHHQLGLRCAQENDGLNVYPGVALFKPSIQPNPVPFPNAFSDVLYPATTNQPLSCAEVSNQFDQNTTSSSIQDVNEDYSEPVSPDYPDVDSFEDWPTAAPPTYSQPICNPSIAPLPPSSAEPIVPHPSKSKTEYRTPDPEPRGPKGGKIRPGRKYEYRIPKNPNAKLRTKQRDVVRDVICDECGQGFNRLSIHEHKKKQHNPNYDTNSRACKLCGEYFKHAYPWYLHYKTVHGDQISNGPPPGKNGNHVCEHCGRRYTLRCNLDTHIRRNHSEESAALKTTYKCSICNPVKVFTAKFCLQSHLRRIHPDQVSIVSDYECPRCTEKFMGEKELHMHLQETHPDSYIRCEWCANVRFSDLAIRLHHRKCSKLPKDVRVELNKKRNEYFPEYFLVPCELCKETYILASLTMHYKNMHNVTEDPFNCFHCDKKFNLRSSWMVHMEEIHGRKLETFFDRIGLLNALNREGISVKPLGYHGCKPKFQRPRRFPGMRSYREGFDYDSAIKSSLLNKRVKRKIKVIAEEDEL